MINILIKIINLLSKKKKQNIRKKIIKIKINKRGFKTKYGLFVKRLIKYELIKKDF
jgi:hypothetical protein